MKQLQEKIFFVIFFLLILFSSILYPQTDLSNSFTIYKTENGLSNRNPLCVLQDRRGFLWIGTEDGLNRFDGYSFKVFRNKKGDLQSISNNFIWSICEDKEGNIWIGTDNGLNKYDPITEKFERFINESENPNSISPGPITSLLADSKRRLWIAVWGEGINVLDLKTKKIAKFKNDPQNNNSLGNNKVFCFFEDAEKKIWIGSDEGGLNLYNEIEKNFKRFPFSQNNIPTSISAIYQQKNKNFILGTSSGEIIQFNPYTGKYNKSKISDNKNISQNIIWKIEEDREGFYWASADVTGLYQFSFEETEQKHKPIRVKEIFLPENKGTKSLLRDNQGNLWILVTNLGLVKIDRQKKYFNQLNSKTTNGKLSDDYVFSLSTDKYDQLWIGTMHNGAFKFNLQSGTIKNYPPQNEPKGLSGEMMRFIYKDKSDALWIGPYYGKLNKYSYETDSFIHFNLDVEGKIPDAGLIRTMFEDSKNNLWIGLNGVGGLIKLNKATGEIKRYANIKVDGKEETLTDIISLNEDKFGNLWIGTYSFGLFCFNPEKNLFEHYVSKENDLNSLADNVVPEIFVDSKSNLWITTYGGLCKYDYDKDNFNIYTTEDGLPSNAVVGIIEDDHQNLWLSTTKGISKFVPSENAFYNFDEINGVQSGEFLSGARCKHKNGYIFFGGVNGITYFHPDSIKLDKANIIPQFTSFKIFNKDVNMQKSILNSDTIKVSYDDKMISFDVSSITLSNPDKIKYSYKVEELNSDWIDLGNQRTIVLTHLDPGEYILKVRSTDYYGNWSESFNQILIIVTPPFWMTWWFRGIFILAFFSIGPFIYYRRVKELKKEKQLQEEFSKQLIESQEKDRKRIASELHDGIGQDLLFIKNIALLNKEKHSAYKDICDSAELAIDEVRRIAYDLRPFQLDRIGLTKAINSIFTNLNPVSKINFKLNIEDIDNCLDKDKELNLFRIIQECVNNILKHSEAKAAEIIITKEAGNIKIIICDNGKGFDPIKAKNLSKGFGLKSMENRVALLNGKIQYTSNNQFSTILNIIIPIDNDK